MVFDDIRRFVDGMPETERSGGARLALWIVLGGRSVMAKGETKRG